MSKEELIHDIKHSLETLAKVLIPVGSAILVGDPNFAVGTSSFLLESFFGIRSRLKLEKIDKLLNGLNDEVDKIKFALKRSDKEVEESQILLENTIYKIRSNETDLKINAYKKILTGHLLREISFDKAQNYIRVISALDEQEIILLYHYKENEKGLSNLKKRTVNDSQIENQILKQEKQRDKFRKQFKSKYTEGELQFVVSMLVSKGLVLKGPGGNGAWFGDGIFNNMDITEFGSDIITFLQADPSSYNV